MAEKVLISAENLRLSIGRQVLFNGISLAVSSGERVALIGRNGSGKSTLLKVISGLEIPASGTVAAAKGLRMAMLPQDFELDETASAAANIRQGLAWFEELHRRCASPEPGIDRDALEHLITLHDAWHPEEKLGRVMEKFHIPGGDRPVGSLSGGEKRRVALARAFVAEPDLLLLDEPTNHLDIRMAEEIEEILASWRGACLFVTHDRFFLDRVATRILELDHGKLFSYSGSYGDYLEAKALRETLEDIAENKRKKFLRDEIEWVRRSPKARLKRNLGRVKRFEELSAVSAPERTGEIELVIPPAPRMGDRTVEMENVSLAFGERTILRDFSFEFFPRCRLGIVGGNGVGKTTLLRLLTGQLRPDSGTVKTADTVIFNYVDQARLALNGEKTVEEEIAEGKSFVELGGEKITVWSYLRRFLFEDERIRTLVKYLSGGEKARLILAKLLKQGGNFLILDEPTNDLDLSTLRLLEEALAGFDGCVAAVSHDRYFLNRVCTHILAMEGDGRAVLIHGDYDYYLSKRAKTPSPVPAPARPERARTVPETPRTARPPKLTYRENLELEGMEAAIEKAEAEVAGLEAIFCRPDFFREYGERSEELRRKLTAAKAETEKLYRRWEELEAKKSACEAAAGGRG